MPWRHQKSTVGDITAVRVVAHTPTNYNKLRQYFYKEKKELNELTYFAEYKIVDTYWIICEGKKVFCSLYKVSPWLKSNLLMESGSDLLPPQITHCRFCTGGQTPDLSEDNESAPKIPGVNAKEGKKKDQMICYPDNVSRYRSYFNTWCKWGVKVGGLNGLTELFH